ncbi:hypothetical protein H2198_003008 [Neophaeococcomyces mojaviensis]|uniref:Uncharacterized protein n=1 Tax=Neophaeococcomyces mojaviensis TaxID=3383035 RepID=A0ACC3ACF5_9EURO|nr:hypothetical protein H2198_003008 [Knufia sp. JES_112]
MEDNHIYQYSFVNALMAGVSDSGISVEKLLSKGNQGIGTFTRMRGELLMIDGKIYQLLGEGKTREPDEIDQIPYAVGTKFVPQKTSNVRLESKESVGQLLKQFEFYSENAFMNYRFDGRFESIKCRTVKGQEYEGQPLAEVGKNQQVQTYHDIEGTIVGFQSPEIWQGFFVAGNHMHFVSKDRKDGGHVLELSDGEGKLGVAKAVNIHMELPTSRAFNDAKLSIDDIGIKAVEG